MIHNILEYLENSAKKFPNKLAVQDEKESCTYEELLRDGKAIGTALAQFAQSGQPIPIFGEKSVSILKLFMGVVYAGCFYILIDTKQPLERIQHILSTLGANDIVTTKEEKEKALFFETLDMEKGNVLLYDELVKTTINETILQQRRRETFDVSPLYTNFTSGSTGTPKGVVVSHRSVIDFIETFTDTFPISQEDVIGNQAPFDFDVSVKDIYSSLKVGATLQIIPKKFFSFPIQLLDYLEERGVTTLIWAVSALCMITTLKGFTYKVPKAINKVLFSGEVMPMKHLHLWQDTYKDALFVNLYGPTEITCNCTYYIVNKRFELGEVLPIGKAFFNEKVFLLDEANKEVKTPGLVGELCVSGTALALGYFNNKEQTEKAFVQNPLNPYYLETIYRTGDLAFYNEEMDLCFASRKDFQIKHMGHRIELGEIEKAFDTISKVERVCCIFHEDKGKIVAYYEGQVEKREIVKILKEKLPVFMIPNSFVLVDKMPLTKNGKIDRQQLKELKGKR